MSIQLTKPLVVPEYASAIVKMYISDPVTSLTVTLPSHTINVQSVLSSLIPGKTANANAVALNGSDLFIANSSPDSQCIFKVPNYLMDPGLAIAQTFVFTLDGNDYVGMAFNAAGDLYAAEGNFPDNHIFNTPVRGNAYPGPALAAVDNYLTRVDLGNAGATSYFANLAFDAAGNLWASDYKNHRLVAFDVANLGGANTYHVLANLDASIPVANTDAVLNGYAVTYLRSRKASISMPQEICGWRTTTTQARAAFRTCARRWSRSHRHCRPPYSPLRRVER